MIIEWPTERDIPSQRELWKEAFGDTDAFLDSFFRTAYSFDRSLVAKEGDRLIASLYWFDCEWSGKPCAYVYAVATDAAYRGRGVCSRLMSHMHDVLRSEGFSKAALSI